MCAFRIISFDGGGIKGALSTRILKRLAQKNPNLIKKTDLFAGTSTGALIALSLAYGLNADEIDDIYSYENIKKIFGHKRFNLFHSRYKNKTLKKLISSTIPEDTTIGDLKKFVFIPSFNLKGVTEDHWQEIFFNNLKDNPTYREKVLDAALASSAAPTYFPIHKNFIDGGVVTNSPAIASVISTLNSNPDKYKLSDFRVLSIGTGITPKRIKSKNNNWGVLNWAINPFSSVKLPLISVLLNDTVQLEDLYAKELLGNNYLRINPLLLDDIELDDYKKVPLLKEIADKYSLSNVDAFIKENF